MATILIAAIDYENKANIKVVEETLSDGSKVYNLWIGSFEYPCEDYKDAERRYGMALRSIED